MSGEENGFKPPARNVEWNRLDDKAVVELVRVGKSENRVYIATLPSGESAVINWSGQDSFAAQRYLDRRCDK